MGNDDTLGALVDAIVAEVLPGPRATPGCPTLGKKEALALLAFVRASRAAVAAVAAGQEGGKHERK